MSQDTRERREEKNHSNAEIVSGSLGWRIECLGTRSRVTVLRRESSSFAALHRQRSRPKTVILAQK